MLINSYSLFIWFGFVCFFTRDKKNHAHMNSYSWLIWFGIVYFVYLRRNHAHELLLMIVPLLVHIIDGPWRLLEVAGDGMDHGVQTRILEHLPGLTLQVAHLKHEERSESIQPGAPSEPAPAGSAPETGGGVREYTAWSTFRACPCR